MRIGGIYSFNDGQAIVESQYSSQLEEIMNVIAAIDGDRHKTKTSAEKTMPGKALYKPGSLNKALEREFDARNWQKHYRVLCDYSADYYASGYVPKTPAARAYREMDFIKGKLGVEVQFGKYAFMVYNVCAKMTIFHNQGVIDAGVEIVPLRELAQEMSTGVSYFEQFVWDLEHRGVADIDIPVLILGVTI